MNENRSNREKSSVSIYPWRMKTSGSFHLVQSQQEQVEAKQNTESLDSSNLDKMQGEEKPAMSIHKAYSKSFHGLFLGKAYYCVRQDINSREYQFTVLYV